MLLRRLPHLGPIAHEKWSQEEALRADVGLCGRDRSLASLPSVLRLIQRTGKSTAIRRENLDTGRAQARKVRGREGPGPHFSPRASRASGRGGKLRALSLHGSTRSRCSTSVPPVRRRAPENAHERAREMHDRSKVEHLLARVPHDRSRVVPSAPEEVHSLITERSPPFAPRLRGAQG